MFVHGSSTAVNCVSTVFSYYEEKRGSIGEDLEKASSESEFREMVSVIRVMN
jgi:hypothetical protein